MQPLEVRQQLTRVQAKKPGSRDSVTTSMTDRNRVEPTKKVTKDTRAPLEVVKPSKAASNLTSIQPTRLNYKATREEMPFTYKGMPKDRFKGKYVPNTPK